MIELGVGVQNFLAAAAVGRLKRALRLLPPRVDFPASKPIVTLTIQVGTNWIPRYAPDVGRMAV